MFGLPVLDFSGLLRTIISASKAALHGFASFGLIIGTPWGRALADWAPGFYQFLYDVEAYVLGVPVLGSLVSAFYSIYGVSSFFDLTFISIAFTCLLAFMIWRFITWILNIVT